MFHKHMSSYVHGIKICTLPFMSMNVEFYRRKHIHCNCHKNLYIDLCFDFAFNPL